jgi:AcrR family transcriptional regulator
MLCAVIDAVDSCGRESLRVAQIVKLARVSRKTFYEHFEDRADCLRAAIEDAAAIAEERARRPSETEDTWTGRVRAGLLALLELLDEEPRLARLCIVHSDSAKPETARYRAAMLRRLADVIDTTGERTRQRPSPLTAEGLVAGTLGVIHARLTSPERESLTDLLGPLMSFIVHPYHGAAAARRELERPPPAAASTRKQGSRGDPWAELGLRMTYRTMRVIAAIGAHPGVSNARACEHAGIADPGQISKLLRRLERLALVESLAPGGRGNGEKAWYLTPQGKRLEAAIDRELVKSRR